ncbi:MAG: hypothetical protein RJA47_329, partial [Actinomycetota bacterium]
MVVSPRVNSLGSQSLIATETPTVT